MKQLFVNGNTTTLFFSKDSSFDDIFECGTRTSYV